MCYSCQLHKLFTSSKVLADSVITFHLLMRVLSWKRVPVSYLSTASSISPVHQWTEKVQYYDQIPNPISNPFRLCTPSIIKKSGYLHKAHASLCANLLSNLLSQVQTLPDVLPPNSRYRQLITTQRNVAKIM